MQLFDFVGDDDAAATAEYLDVLAAALAQQVNHILEVLDVAALVGGDGDAMHILLNGGVHDFVDRPVVAEMDDFDAAGLEDAAHDVDRCIMAVEQARCGNEANFVLCLITLFRALHTQIGHGDGSN